jgi:hypothetical protein
VFAMKYFLLDREIGMKLEAWKVRYSVELLADLIYSYVRFM